MTYTDITGAARMLRLSYGQMLRLVTRADVEAVRINGHWRVARESVERYAERQRNGQEASA